MDLKICLAKWSALGTFIIPRLFFHRSRFIMALGASVKKLVRTLSYFSFR